ncbi:MAG: DUF1853 family protein [Gammaproteobacteria bacterium]|nr:DUF1853 family protein [Gammaproteobacteria bacterium]
MYYQTPQVRHLAWSLFSPPMAIISEAKPLVVDANPITLNWLNTLDNNPEPLLTYLSTQNSRLLGSYFECLWQFFFQYAPHWQLLAHHIQVRDQSNTLGELDLVAQNCTSNSPIHVELAVKFYLYDHMSREQGLSGFLGPQSHDRLDLKLNKLQHKQLPFLHHPNTQARLQELNIPFPDSQLLALKGYLFKPFSQDSFPQNEMIHSDCPNGTWLHQKHSQTIFAEHNAWVILPKLEWLGPYACSLNPEKQNLAVLTRKQAQIAVEQHFKSSEYPYALMLAKLRKSENFYEEIDRFMLVQDQWPRPVKTKKKT